MQEVAFAAEVFERFALHVEIHGVHRRELRSRIDDLVDLYLVTDEAVGVETEILAEIDIRHAVLYPDLANLGAEWNEVEVIVGSVGDQGLEDGLELRLGLLGRDLELDQLNFGARTFREEYRERLALRRGGRRGRPGD